MVKAPINNEYLIQNNFRYLSIFLSFHIILYYDFSRVCMNTLNVDLSNIHIGY